MKRLVLYVVVLFATRISYGNRDITNDPNIYNIHLHRDDIILYLYVRNHENFPEIIQTYDGIDDLLYSKYFNSKRDNLFIIHCVNDNYKRKVNKLIMTEILKSYDVNVFVVDWSHINKIAKFNYTEHVVNYIGKVLGKFVKRMMEYYELTSNDFYMIGHGVGAHICGVIGTFLNGQIDTIIGLDPHGYKYILPDLFLNTLNTSSANFVEMIHTNYNGDVAKKGHADFYPNGGSQLYVCKDIKCQHELSIDYYVESITKPFYGRQCECYDNFLQGFCNDTKIALMGGFYPIKNISGKFYLNTNYEAPYAKALTPIYELYSFPPTN